MYELIHVRQGVKYLLKSIKQKARRTKHNVLSAEEICHNIVNKCWNGRYYRTSTCHYTEFWARDFGLVVDSLKKIDEKRTETTTRYALQHYKQGIKTTIDSRGRSFSFPNLYSPDSVSLLLYSVSKFPEIVNENQKMLQKEADRFSKKVLAEGFVKPADFSNMRDHAKQESSCYNHCMSILMAKNAKVLGLDFNYTEKELRKNLNEYWTGAYYKASLTDETITGDANIFPYLIGAGRKFSKMLKTVEKEGLTKPFPMKYCNKKQEMRITEKLVPGWQERATWPMMGLPFVKITEKHNMKKAKEWKAKYKHIIEKHGTLFEVYIDNKPYQSLLYHADRGMIWAANYSNLKRNSIYE